MNKQRQAAFPEPKRKFLEQRLVAEIAEFFRAEKHYKECKNYVQFLLDIIDEREF